MDETNFQILKNEQIVNRLRLVNGKLDACKLLMSYLPDVNEDPMLRKLYQDIAGAHVSCTSALREKETPVVKL